MNPNQFAGWPEATQWSLLLGQLGKGFVFSGLGFFLLSLVFSSVKRFDQRIPVVALGLGSLCLASVMGILVTLFVRMQFQYEYVFSHADKSSDLQYKVAGVWSGQQGSFLLWGLCSAIFGLLAIKGTGPYRRWYTIVFATFLAAICGILAYETPFNLARDFQAHGKTFIPPNGTGLNPTLQNYWVVIHPPVIFVGFGALTTLFAYSVAAMMTGNIKDWVPRARPWALAAMAVLGLGICMGGFWAYETLGWGGFWAWDPVENVSFVPWLVVAALIHGMIVQVTRSRWYGANLLLAGVPFLLFVYGTFLTRSGLLTDVSVHSFAEMDKNALKILLGFLIASILFFFGLYMVRGRKLVKEMRQEDAEPGIHRESAYALGSLLLCIMALVISVGMSWPVILSLAGKEMAIVEEGLYHRVVVWFFVPIILLMGVGPFLAWRKMEPKAVWSKLLNIVAASIFLTGLAVFGFRNPVWGIHVQESGKIPFPFGIQAPLLPWMAFLTFICIFAFVSNFVRAAQIVKRSRPSVGAFVSHLGMAVLMAGLILSRGFERVEKNIIIQPGAPGKALDYVVAYRLYDAKDEYDRNGKVELEVIGQNDRFVAKPGLFYVTQADGEDRGFVSPYIKRTFSHDVYVTLHEPRIFVWDQPQWFKPGETKTVNNVTVNFIKPTTKGNPGEPGTEFGAIVDVTIQGKTYRANPTFLVGRGPTFAPVGEELVIVMPQMNAGEGSVALQVLFGSPVYPVDLYYKPLTSLVWLGAGILFLGGMIAAFYRRFRRVEVPEVERSINAPTSEKTVNAPVPAT